MPNLLVNNAWLVPFFPLLGALIAAAFGRELREKAHLPVVVGIFLAFLVSLGLLFSAGPDKVVTVYRWLEFSNLNVPIQFRVDGLTTMMLSMVTFVSTLVAIYAAGYMAGDPGYPRFFTCVGLFVFSMTGLVLSNNYVLTYVFWEGVGTCSYLLVGFWHAKPSAAAAAKKAFLVNRVGDFGFAIALFWLWTVVPNHDLSYGNVLSASTLAGLPQGTIEGIALLLFWAATAKSAQVPLYVWLPDAMEGPTPVSALIHAATMVTAGVYLIARSTPLIALAPNVQLLIASIGCLTALLSASIAVTQTDLKRVMAYSTVSQLGFMFMGIGAGVGTVAKLAVFAAMFHLFTHAFFKALLFLASGSVMHSMGGVIDMRRFRGLRHRMPITCWTFAIGGLALSGIPPFAGFFSKDEILVALKEASHAAGHGGAATGYRAIYWIAIFTAMMTAFYTGRAFFMTFFGPEKLPSADDPEAEEGETAHGHGSAHDDHGHGHDAGHGHGHDSHFGHESPPVMTYPLIALAGCAVMVGVLFGPTGLFEHHIMQSFAFETLGHPEHAHGLDLSIPLTGTLVGVLGLVASFFLYAKPSPIPARLASSLKPLYRASCNKFYIDELYDMIFIRPLRMIASVSAFLDEWFLHGALIRGTAWMPRLLGREVLAPLQNGLIQYYAAVTALGVAGLLWVLLLLK
ncbi:NADH-quinone oxidoreductase subunit L [Singulisphaera sp. Ch08]|uniref:NADH-quinone oxidoreductase subunit L n=1 Tax=Singulisphaera sp. Ch08 TaxID=3120278 RepID=A0AAU7CEJ7_9BACT